MPNLLGVTNPVPNYDASNNRINSTVPKPTDTQIQNIPDPSRVGRADARTDQQGADNSLNTNVLRYDSNFQFFLQELRNMPELTVELSKAIAWMRGIATTPGLSEGIAKELEGLLQMFQMDTEQFRNFFLSQVQTNNRFSGPLFSILRQVYQQTSSQSVQESILNFVKRYSDFSSTDHIGRHMLQMLQQIKDYMPQSWRGQLLDLIGKLENGLQAGDRSGNLKLLQGEILPYLSSYITRYHDLGTARTLLGMLVLDMARYENGGENGLMMAFRQLGGYGEKLSGLGKLDDAAVWNLLKDSLFAKSVETDQFATQLAQTATRALNGEYGAEMHEAFQEIMRALMVNESVYMPLNHMIIPLEYEGKRLYSEFWVDPDAEEKQGEAKDAEREKIQFLFKMDIESLGFMEMTLSAWKEQVELNIYGPQGVFSHAGIVAEDIKQILEDHNLVGKNIQVLEEKRPLTLTEVFPDLFEGKQSINVKI